MKLARSTAPLLLAVLMLAFAQGCAAQRYADDTYAEAGVKFAWANQDDIGRWIANAPGISGTEQTALRAQLDVWLLSPGVPAVDQAFDDAVGYRLESWAANDPTLPDLDRRVILADIRSWRRLVASRRG